MFGVIMGTLAVIFVACFAGLAFAIAALGRMAEEEMEAINEPIYRTNREARNR